MMYALSVDYRTFIKMEDFGGESPKGTWLYSQFSWTSELTEFATGKKTQPRVQKKPVSLNWFNKQGKRKWCGGAGLKNSQAYPPGFGKAVQKTFQKHRADLEAHVADLEDRAFKAGHANAKVPVFERCTDQWSDAQLKPVFKLFM